MKDKELSNKIKRKKDNFQEPTIGGASETVIKRSTRKSFNGDPNMTKVISSLLNNFGAAESVTDVILCFCLYSFCIPSVL